MQKKEKIFLLSRYSVIDVLSVIKELKDCRRVFFMPKIANVPYASKLKRKLVKIIINTISKNISIQEIPHDEIIEHYMSSNTEAAQYLVSKTKEFIDYNPVKFLDRILQDSTVVNYFQASLVYAIFNQALFLKVTEDYSNKFSKVGWIGNNINQERQQRKSISIDLLESLEAILNFLTMIRLQIMIFLVPFYFLFKHLRNGIELQPKLRKPLLTSSFTNAGISADSPQHLADYRGTKMSTDESLIYGEGIQIGDVVHVFGYWSIEPKLKQRYFEICKTRGIDFIDSDRLKINPKILSYIFYLVKVFLQHTFPLSKNFNNYNHRIMLSFLPKAIYYLLKKELEIQHACPKIDLIKNDYNPGSIIQAIVCKNKKIKTIGQQHTATPYDCPQLCFVNYDQYLLFSNFYREQFKGFLQDTSILINGKDILDTVIELNNNPAKQEAIKEEFTTSFGEHDRIILIILPGDGHTIRKYMKTRMLNTLRRWESSSINKNTKIILRFRVRKNIIVVPEWKLLYELAKNNKQFIVDFDQFTTPELIFLSDLVIVPHASYAMTECLALNKRVISFDFSGSAAHYYKDYGPDLVITEEEELYKILNADSSHLDALDINFIDLAHDLDSYYDGNNVSRLRQLIINM